MHPDEGGASMKRDRRKLLEGFQRENIRKWIQHKAILLSWRPPAGRKKIPLGIHVTNAAGVSLKDLYDGQCARVQDMYAPSFGGGAEILAGSLHDCVLSVGDELRRVRSLHPYS